MNDDTAPKPDGGPMFPNPATGYGGMTLRDWFAGQALAGLTTTHGPETGVNVEALAFNSYAVADAMIAHRNATREG